MPRSYGLLSSYPPTRCGVATFAYALTHALADPASGDRAGMVRVLDAPVRTSAPEVVGHLYTHARDGSEAAAAALNTFDVVLVHYEIGLYGGTDGDQVLAVLDRLRVPTVIVVHTVLDAPTAHQAHVLHRAIAASAAVVTMTETARDRLIRRHDVDPAKVQVIRHGPKVAPTPAVAGQRPLILTWGLLEPGKGIEWAIDGLQRLRYLRPSPAYIVAGQTRPSVQVETGERYRSRLAQRARLMGVSQLYRSIDSYLDDAALGRLIRRANVVLLPYDSPDQATSPVLAEAVAAGKPVIATAFPHAVELLSTGAGMLVPHRDGTAIGDALHRVLTEPGLASRMAAEATRLAAQFSWPIVADRFRALVSSLLAAERTP